MLPWLRATRQVPSTSRFSCLAGGSRRWAKLNARNIGTPYVSRRTSRTSLEKASKKSFDRILLLPPYTAAYELRIIFSLDYASVFRLLGVNKVDKKYYWKDYEKRYFETVTKRKAIFPFEMVSALAHSLGFRPHMVDVEPDWSPQSPISLGSAFPPVPVVAILGHINHGKTTLIDRLCGTSYVREEPGNITQEVRAMTAWISEPSVTPRFSFTPPDKDNSAHSKSSASNARFDAGRLTLLDTPGHEAFDELRGRTIASADVAVVVVSVERGAEVQTEEVLLHASKWQVPIVFALNKIDLPDAHVELTRAELRRQCQRLFEAEDVDVDWTKEAEQAVPISALHGLHLDKLINEINQAVAACPAIPSKPVTPPTRTPGEAVAKRKIPKRTDFLVGAEVPPHAMGLVVEVRKMATSGETVLTVIVRGGRLVVGHYFVVGTAMGRISHLALATGTEASWRREQVCESATTGVAVHLAGIKRNLGGDCSPDDILYTVDRERAWRLSEYRRRIETLSNIQVDGPSLEVPWVHDGVGVIRTQAAFQRNHRDHVEMHSNSAYDRRWQQPAVQDVTIQGGSQTFVGDRRSFEAPFAKVGWPGDEEYEEVAKVARGQSASRSRRFLVAEPAREGEDEDSQGIGSNRGSTSEEAEAATASSHGGRKSSRMARSSAQPWGAWADSEQEGTDKRDFVYYTDRETWTEEAGVDTRRLRERWQWRDQRRWEEEEIQARQRKEEKEIVERVRREVYGEEEKEEEEESMQNEEDEEDDNEDDVPVEPLPPTKMPVISLILKTKLSTQFDVIMDEMESIQERYGVRVAIVHGGLGPVIPRDVTHAEVEKYYGFCPIYAFQVGSHPVALGQAERERVDIRRFDVFTDLVLDVEARCNAVHYKAEQRNYQESLSSQPTRSKL